MPDERKRTPEIVVLSVAVAVLVWMAVSAGKTAEVPVSVPVRYVNVPAGLVIAAPVPSTLQGRIAGPRLALLQAGDPPAVVLDLAGCGEGATTFSNLDGLVVPPWGTRLSRLFPSEITLRLAKREEQQTKERNAR